MVEPSGWPRRLIYTAQLAALAAVERRVPFWSIERIERAQRRRLRAIVRHAFETVPYYRELMAERGLRPDDLRTAADLARLPLLDGELVRRDPARFASARYDDRSRHVSHTTGTRSHVQKLIWWDDASVHRRLAHNERDRVVLTALAGKGWGQRQLYILPATGHALQRRALWEARALFPRWLAERRVISPELPFDEVAAAINAFRPHVVFSVGSFADHFVRLVMDRGLDLALPRVWAYGGDMLSPGGRALIESFGCVVYSTYQAVETGRLGFQCERRDGFHLNVDLVAVRVVDGAGRDAAPGEAGEVVVSNLHNRATVLFNYRLEDRGVLAAAPCPCGRSLPVLARLEGRTSEVITLADGRTLSSVAVRSLFDDELAATFKAQVVHPAPGVVRWRIVPLAGADSEALRQALLAKGREVFGEGTRVAIELVADIPYGAGGKFPGVVTDATASWADDGPGGADA